MGREDRRFTCGFSRCRLRIGREYTNSALHCTALFVYSRPIRGRRGMALLVKTRFQVWGFRFQVERVKMPHSGLNC